MSNKNNEQSVINQKIDTVVEFSKQVLELKCLRHLVQLTQNMYHKTKTPIPSAENLTLMLDQIDTKIKDKELTMHNIISPLFGNRKFKILNDVFWLNSKELGDGYVLLTEEDERGEFIGNSILFLTDIFDKKKKIKISKGEIHKKSDVYYLLKHLQTDNKKTKLLANYLIELKKGLFEFKKHT